MTRTSSIESSPSESGNVVVEFAAVVVALIVPLAYVGQACWTVATSSLALRAGVHAAARAFVLSSSLSVANSRAHSAYVSALQDAGVWTSDSRMHVTCTGPCLAAGSFVTVSGTQRLRIATPFGTWSMPVTASDTSVVDEFK